MRGKRLVSPWIHALILTGTLFTSLHAQDLKPAGKESRLTIGGLVQAQGEFGDQGDSRFTKNDRFLLRRARINVQGGFLEEFDFRVELDLGGTGSALRAQMTDGYVQWNASKTFAVRFGQFKTPFGFEQLVSDPVLFTIERALANDRLTISRQLGLQLSANTVDKRVTATAGLFNGNGVNNGLNDNEDFVYVARLAAVPVQTKYAGQEVKWSAGFNAYASQDTALALIDFGFDAAPGGARDNLFTGKRSGLGLDSQVHLGPFDLWAEVLWARFKPVNSLPANRLTARGWYAQASCYFARNKAQAIVKYEIFDPNIHAAGNTTKTWVAGVNGYVKAHDIKLQLDVQHSDAPGLSSGENKAFVRMQVVF